MVDFVARRKLYFSTYALFASFWGFNSLIKPPVDLPGRQWFISYLDMSYCSPGTSGRRASCSYISTNLSSQFIPDTKRRNSAFSTLGLGLHTPSAPKECKKLQRFFRRRSNSLAEINGLSKSRLSTFTLGSNVNRKDATRRCQVVVEMHGGQKYIVSYLMEIF